MHDCVQAVGKLHTLWIAFAKFYERHGDIENARVIFDKATQVRLPPQQTASCAALTRSMPRHSVPVYTHMCVGLCIETRSWPLLVALLRLDVLGQVALRYVEDLATVWCEWCEMELRHKNFKSALELMRRATYTPDKINRKEVRPRSKSSLTMYQSWAG